MAKRKWYAIRCGRVPGIYTSWPEAEKQVKGFPKARFKGFATREEAEAWLSGDSDRNTGTVGQMRKKRESNPQSRRLQQSITENAAAKAGVIIHTDGGALNNPGPGGYGVVIQRAGKVQELCCGYRLTTNNRMELLAAIVALRELKDSSQPIALFSDSSYVVNGMRKGWAKNWRKKGWRKADGKPVLNQDLWVELLELTEKLPVTFHWVKGHAGNPMNERCDKLAVGAARGRDLLIDKGYEEKAGSTW